MIKLNCKKCNKDFLVSPYRENTAHYCSQECSHSSEIRLKTVSEKLKGRICNPKTIFKKGHDFLGKKENLNFKKGHIPWNKGIEFPQVKGENNVNWNGGSSLESYGNKFTFRLKESIRTRDGRRCNECNFTEKDLGYRLCVHHIDYNKKNNTPNNLISLCRLCHSQTNFSRSDWEKYFTKRCVASA